jgi:hypothetical protein
MTKAVAKAEDPKVPATAGAFDMSRFQTGSTGLEKVTSNDLLIPRIVILQGLSPQCTQGKPEYNEDLRPGMFFDVGLSESFGKGPLAFLPVAFDKKWIEWAPRDSGKGLQNIYDTDEIMDQTEPDQNGRDMLPNGNYVVETSQVYGLNLNAKLRPSFISFTSTQLKKARRWMTLATTQTIEMPDGNEVAAPLWYRAYKLGTVGESNSKGAWIGFTIEPWKAIPEFATEEEPQKAERLFAAVTKFRESIERGEVKADTSQMDDGDVGGKGGGKSRAQEDTGQEM